MDSYVTYYAMLENYWDKGTFTSLHKSGFKLLFLFFSYYADECEFWALPAFGSMSNINYLTKSFLSASFISEVLTNLKCRCQLCGKNAFTCTCREESISKFNEKWLLTGNLFQASAKFLTVEYDKLYWANIKTILFLCYIAGQDWHITFEVMTF